MPLLLQSQLGLFTVAITVQLGASLDSKALPFSLTQTNAPCVYPTFQSLAVEVT